MDKNGTHRQDSNLIVFCQTDNPNTLLSFLLSSWYICMYVCVYYITHHSYSPNPESRIAKLVNDSLIVHEIKFMEFK